MPTFWHLDARGTIREGDVLGPVVYAPMGLPDSYADLLELFPEGFTPGGWRRLTTPLAALDVPTWGALNLELVLELVRRARFPDKPSRLAAVFAHDSLAMGVWAAGKWREAHQEGPDIFWLVESERFHRGDQNIVQPLLTRTATLMDLVAEATHYWQGKAGAGLAPWWEMVLPGPAHAIRRATREETDTARATLRQMPARAIPLVTNPASLTHGNRRERRARRAP
jgi:hypothetical protein